MKVLLKNGVDPKTKDNQGNDVYTISADLPAFQISLRSAIAQLSSKEDHKKRKLANHKLPFPLINMIRKKSQDNVPPASCDVPPSPKNRDPFSFRSDAEKEKEEKEKSGGSPHTLSLATLRKIGHEVRDSLPLHKHTPPTKK